MNEKLYKANVELVDENRILKEDKKALQRRIDKAIEYVKTLQFNFDFEKDIKKFAFDFLYTNQGKKLLEILKGEYINE